jgi:ABC-type multidrug transport system ATPase subunit
MKILLDQVGKKFQHHWIFKNISYTFSESKSYALLGHNGSGKSTLLRIIASIQSPSKGKVFHEYNGKEIDVNQLNPFISFCAPGMEIVDEFTLREFLHFHFSFKKSLQGLSVNDIIDIIGLAHAADKILDDFSSGMKQRVKLAQAIFCSTPFLLLDEPCTNLDDNGVAQYLNWMEQYSANRLVIIASNDEREYSFCKEKIWVEKFKS